MQNNNCTLGLFSHLRNVSIVGECFLAPQLLILSPPDSSSLLSLLSTRAHTQTHATHTNYTHTRYEPNKTKKHKAICLATTAFCVSTAKCTLLILTLFVISFKNASLYESPLAVFPFFAFAFAFALLFHTAFRALTRVTLRASSLDLHFPRRKLRRYFC